MTELVMLSEASPCKTSMNLLKKVARETYVTSWTAHQAVHFMFRSCALHIDWREKKEAKPYGSSVELSIVHLYAKKVHIFCEGGWKI